MRPVLSVGLAVAAVATLAPISGASAHEHDRDDPEWRGADWQRESADPRPRFDPRPQFDPRAREAWLADCRHRISVRDDGVGGAVIGGVVGGVAGNRIAGRHHRTTGTIVGAAAGAVAGAAIDRAEDSRAAADQCEAYLNDYQARYYGGPGVYPYGYSGPGYAGGGYPVAYAAPYSAPGYGYPGGCCMSAPVMMVPVALSKPECTETIEYVYEDVPVRQRTIYRTKIIRDKRVKIVPDKRVLTK